MRKRFFMAFLFLPLVSVYSQMVILNETFGNPQVSPTLVSAYNGWSDKTVTYTSIATDKDHTVEIRNNQNSEYANGAPLASGEGNLYLNGDATSFKISGINAQGYHKMRLSFGLFGKTETSFYSFKVFYSVNGGAKVLLKSFQNVECVPQAWQYVSDIALPDDAADSNLSLTFELAKTEGVAKVRIDDVRLVGLAGEDDEYASLTLDSDLKRFETEVNGVVSQDITFSGTGVTDIVTLELKNKHFFSLSKDVITAEELVSSDVSVTITYSPDAVQYSADTLVVSTANLASPLYVLLEGKSTLPEVQNLNVEQVGSALHIAWEEVPEAENYLLTITRKQQTDKTTIFKEDFSNFVETEKFEIGDCIDDSLKTAKQHKFFESAGWQGKYVYNGSDDDKGEIEGVCRLGKKAGGNGWLNTPYINLSEYENVYMSFKVRTFSKSGSTEVPVIKAGYCNMDDGTQLYMNTLENLHPEFEEYIYKIDNPGVETYLRITGTTSSALATNNRYIIDDLEVFSTGNALELPLVKNLLLTENSYSIDSLLPGEIYEITVRAYNPSVVLVSENATVEFQTANAVEVSFETEIGETPAAIKVYKGSVATEEQLPNLEKEGWTFMGWYSRTFDGEYVKVIAGEYVFDQNVMLMAKWKENHDAIQNVFEEYGIEYYVQNDMLVIESSRKSKLQILSLSGQQVHACGLLEGRNEICCLPQGVYLLRIGNKVAKVLIN
ncbi:MAG: hypothetical protein ILP24_05450 [Paludibacteraceae bacterium]|nr:hypothetical protein [Paludibacteraceae bacterium]